MHILPINFFNFKDRMNLKMFTPPNCNGLEDTCIGLDADVRCYVDICYCDGGGGKIADCCERIDYCDHSDNSSCGCATSEGLTDTCNCFDSWIHPGTSDTICPNADGYCGLEICQPEYDIICVPSDV